jgi:hypothetical protein
MQPSEAVQAHREPALEVEEIVRETLVDVTPRAATLALLRFTDYLQLIEQAGVTPSEELAAALFEELRAICVRDRSARPRTRLGRGFDRRR